jgi:hypothetical protein
MTKLELLNNSPERMWVNQPSTLQEFHEYHGENVLSAPPVTYSKNNCSYIRVYFTKGKLVKYHEKLKTNANR